ncbi:inosine/xanthosine triphosphatase [Ignisphaera sp. 4213-co]|uniref:Probable inosine/xanthosine triphosphatase n=1 Tax=Ignisphaera cupida TaxID=3050454 RepID=A0ABD4Z6D1_9CREN|nr:inosine/xanthosine triphosphatase [Ignisphaera sp. 4213-co]MDK6028674.1 inosine/xanthosine triphosphatase [Ignisphaera sp. 4213-co]
MELRVCVGSKNPSKIEGVRRAFQAFFNNVDVKGCAVETGLPPQPIGIEITMRGARIRAEKALKCFSDCDFGVGVEAGFISFGEVFYDVQVTYIVDRNGFASYGFSPAFPIPKKFAELIIKGVFKELEEVVDNFYGTKNIGEKGGFIKLLTKGVVRREDLTYYSVIAALIPFINKDVYM